MKRYIIYAIVVVLVMVANQADARIDPALRLLICVAGLALLMLIAFLGWLKQKRGNDAKPIISVQAEVTGRRTQVEKRGKYHVRVCYLTFTTQDGSVLAFEVSELEFSRMDMGERGKLEYRGYEYLGLRRYDLGEMAPVVQPEEGAPSRRRAEGVLTHELEE